MTGALWDPAHGLGRTHLLRRWMNRVRATGRSRCVRRSPLPWRCSLGHDGGTYGREGYHPARMARGPINNREVSPGDARAGRGARCHWRSPRLPHRGPDPARLGPHRRDRIRRLLFLPGIRRGDRLRGRTGNRSRRVAGYERGTASSGAFRPACPGGRLDRALCH